MHTDYCVQSWLGSAAVDADGTSIGQADAELPLDFGAHASSCTAYYSYSLYRLADKDNVNSITDHEGSIKASSTCFMTFLL